MAIAIDPGPGARGPPGSARRPSPEGSGLEPRRGKRPAPPCKATKPQKLSTAQAQGKQEFNRDERSQDSGFIAFQELAILNLQLSIFNQGRFKNRSLLLLTPCFSWVLGRSAAI
jgi:hypothetical protein